MDDLAKAVGEGGPSSLASKYLPRARFGSAGAFGIGRKDAEGDSGVEPPQRSAPSFLDVTGTITAVSMQWALNSGAVTRPGPSQVDVAARCNLLFLPAKNPLPPDGRPCRSPRTAPAGPAHLPR